MTVAQDIVDLVLHGNEILLMKEYSAPWLFGGRVVRSGRRLILDRPEREFFACPEAELSVLCGLIRRMKHGPDSVEELLGDQRLLASVRSERLEIAGLHMLVLRVRRKPRFASYNSSLRAFMLGDID